MGGTIVDLAREHALLAAAEAESGRRGLNPAQTTAVLQDQIEPSKVVQYGLFADWTADPGRAPAILRAGHDLMGVNPRATRSAAGMPRGRSLYGPIPEQLTDDTSFVRQLQAILRVRSHYGIATSRQVDIPDVSSSPLGHSGLRGTLTVGGGTDPLFASRSSPTKIDRVAPNFAVDGGP